ncbi:sulfatase [Segatella asaccharophila]
MNTDLFRHKATSYSNPAHLIAVQFFELYLVAGFILRIILMLTGPAAGNSFSFLEIVRLLGVGVLSDSSMCVLLLLPLLLVYLGLNEWKYSKAAGWVIEGLWLAAFVYVWFFHSIFADYGGAASRIARIFLTWKLISFSLRFFIPGLRNTWRKISVYFTWILYVFLFLIVCLAEYFFWQEFGVRFNFIAVDYLVYTHETIGNIMQSYAVIPLFTGAFIIAALIVFLCARTHKLKMDHLFNPIQLAAQTGLYLVTCVIAFILVSWTCNLQSNDEYVTQLEQNGPYDFLNAFRSNKLEYNKFYAMIPRKECMAIYRNEAGLDKHGEKQLGQGGQARKLNIVLVTVESLSGEYLTRYGNQDHLTPELDKIMTKSLVFDNLYAAGNRTVRGLEALSLCVPPSAGESIIKRADNRMGSYSAGAQLKRLGYHVQFLYGGDSYFDNMGNYFSHNGYEVIDRNQIPKKDISFANIWGVCDGDMFRKSLQVFDQDARDGKPFFAQIMTTSNHRPYTYPAGKIKVVGDPKSRDNAVRYTDYAIGHFIAEASRKPWFHHTVFVIIADHCASSAGKTSLPIEKYHIPCIVYSPGNIKPQYVKTLCSQIDVMPTLMSILNLPCKVKYTGSNILAGNFKPRAFMATYQDLGYMQGHTLTVLSPVRKIQQYDLKPLGDWNYNEILRKQPDQKIVRKAQAYYQYVNLYFKGKK